jgi:hypothetical protein
MRSAECGISAQAYTKPEFPLMLDTGCWFLDKSSIQYPESSIGYYIRSVQL